MRTGRPWRLLIVALLTACGLGESDAVEEVDPDLLAGLDEPTTTTTTPTAPATEATTTSTVPTGVPTRPSTTVAGTSTTIATETMTAYFIEGSLLVPTEVEVPEGASLRTRLSTLEDGPPPSAADGVRTALPAGLVTGVLLRPGGILVRLDGDLFDDIDTVDQRLVIGQLVLTLTEQAGVEEVSFVRGDTPLRVYREDNTLTAPGEPVRRGDYEVLLEGAAGRLPGDTQPDG